MNKSIAQKLKNRLLVALFVPLIVIIRVIKPIVLIRFGSFMSFAVGHLSANPDIYLCEKAKGIHRNAVDLFFLHSTGFVSNKALLDMWIRTGRFILVSQLVHFLNEANKLLPGFEKHIVKTTSKDFNSVLIDSQPNVDFTDEELRIGQAFLEKVGVCNQQFICFHNRCSAYKKETPRLSHLDYGFQDYRNSEIKSYIPAAIELSRHSIYSFRMGHGLDGELNVANDRIIDYASKYRNEFLDIFLSAKCKFYIFTDSGVSFIPRMFRKPGLLVNFTYIHENEIKSFPKSSMFLFKKIYLKNRGRFLTFKEMSESGFLPYDEQILSFLRSLGDIDIIDNTAEEITDAAVEMNLFLDDELELTIEEQELQREFWSLFLPDEVYQMYKPMVSKSFLENNIELLN